MKSFFMSLVVILACQSANAVCICAKGSKSYQDTECYYNNGVEECYYVTKYTDAYTAKVIINAKEYDLESFLERSKCLEFLKSAPECK